MAATIYFAGGQDTSFSFVGTVDVNTNTEFCRPAWSQSVIEIAGSVSDPPASHALSRPFVDKSNNLVYPSSFWVRSFFAWSALGGGSTTDAQMLRVLDASLAARLVVRAADNAGTMKISKRDISGTFTDLVSTAAGALPVAGLSPASIDLFVANDTTVSYGARTDITFTPGPPGVITTAAGNFASFGLIPPSSVIISGSASNDGTYTVSSATTNTLTISGTTFVAESPGASVTFTCNGQVLLYFNTTLVAAFAGDITTNGVSAMGYVDLASCWDTVLLRWSETIVSDQSTLTKGLWTRPPLAPGASQFWAPNTVGNVSKAIINDSTFVSTAGVDQVSTWTGSASSPGGGSFLVDAVIQEARLAAGDIGPQHVAWVVQLNGTVEVGSTIAPSTALENFAYTWSENPITGLDWELTDMTVNTLDLGVESLA